MLATILAGSTGIMGITILEEQSMAQQASSKSVQLRAEGEFPPLDGATEWLNSPPLTKAELRGKVVLIDSGPIPASTGDARSRMSALGLRNTRRKDW